MEQRKNFALGIAWAIMVGAIACTITLALSQTIAELIKLGAAIIGAASIIMVAILNHTTAVIRAEESEKRRAKQENYRRVVKRLANYVRSQRNDKDLFECAHLETWVYGSTQVVELAQDFMAEGGNDRIKELLLAMRKDIGLDLGGLNEMEIEFLTLPKITTPENMGNKT